MFLILARNHYVNAIIDVGDGGELHMFPGPHITTLDHPIATMSLNTTSLTSDLAILTLAPAANKHCTTS